MDLAWTIDYAHCCYLLTGLLEGVKNDIKGDQVYGYGFRDDHCFFLKISAAFRGVPG